MQLPMPFSSMPQRPMVEGFRGFQQPFYRSNNLYGTGRPVLPYQQRSFVLYQDNNVN